MLSQCPCQRVWTCICPPVWPYASQHYPTDNNNFLLRVFFSPTLSYVTYQRQLTVVAATDKIKARRRLQPLSAAVLHIASGLARSFANYPVPCTNSSHAPSHYTLFAPRASHFTIAIGLTSMDFATSGVRSPIAARTWY